MIKEKIKNQPTQENPIIIKNYPYGFKKTLKRYWIETNKGKGQRVGEQTLNPKTQKWNNPKKSTYSDIIILYKNEDDHIKAYSFSLTYSDEENLKKFESSFNEEDLNDYQKNQIKTFRAILKTREHISFTIHENPSKEEIKAINEKESESKKQINGIFNHYARKEGVLI